MSLQFFIFFLLEATERLFFTKDWITVVLIIIFSLFVVSKLYSGDRFYNLFSLVYSKNYLIRYQKQVPLLINSFHISFAVIQVLTFSLIIFIGIRAFNTVARELELTFFLSILAGVFMFFVLRYFIGTLLATLFDKEKEFEYITYMKMSYLSNFCLLIFPVLLVAVYAKYDSIKYSLFVLAISAIILFFYYLLIVNNNQRIILRRLFYFILYLCALEIAPIILLYKLFIV